MSLPSWVAVGRKCVCIKKGAWENTFDDVFEPTSDPAYGEICTIVETGYVNGAPTIWLAGYGLWFGYSPTRFRPLISQSDDLKAHFSELLNVSTPQRVEA